MMRIAFDARWIRTSNLENVGGYSIELLCELFKIDPANEYVLIFDSEDRRDYFKKVARPERFSKVELVLTGLSAGALRDNAIFFPRFLKKHAIDVIHVPYYLFSPLKGGAKLIGTIYDLASLLYPRYSVTECPLLWLLLRNRFLARALIMRADRFVVSSKHSGQYLNAKFGYPNERIDLIYPGISERIKRVTDEDALESVAAKYGLPRDYILFMGEFGRHKNLEGLVKAYLSLDASLRKRHKLVIIGRGEELYPTKESSRLDLAGLKSGDIITPGYILMEDKPAIYSMASAFVSPTLYEGFPLFILEAMACGVPVACSGIETVNEFVGDAVLRFNSHERDSIKAALEKILTDAAIRSSLAQKGLERARRFSWSNTARQTLDLYNNVMKK